MIDSGSGSMKPRGSPHDQTPPTALFR